MKTKEKILQAAIQLFNNEGVEKVTTLYISKEMGISLGNLHYQYPNRNTLIKAIIDRFLTEAETLSVELMQEKAENFMIQAFRTQFIIFKKMWEYRFLFTDRLVIARRMDYLETHFKAMVQLRKHDFDKTMIELKRSGMIDRNIAIEVQNAYFQQMVIWNNSWVNYCDLFSYDEQPYIYFAEQSIWTWRPYLNCTDEDIRKAIKEVKTTFLNE